MSSDDEKEYIIEKVTRRTPPAITPVIHFPGQRSAVIGKDTEKGREIPVGDEERRSGLYILGKPRMGKSWLLINMILQDIEKGKGVFFIDPHGDAIDQLTTHINIDRSPFTIYDFEDEEKIMCINPLAGNRSDPAVRNGIFAKTKAIFDKLWKNTFEEKPWLQLIIQNTIYVFIENKEFTLVDFPLFFTDRDFRHYLISKMQYNMQVKDYWQKTFASKDRRNQDSIMEAAQTRCEIMFAHPPVRHFFGNGNHVSLADSIQMTRPRFVKFSTRLPNEVKKIIGTALINELVFAFQRRIPGSPLYCLYIDEFQNFVSFEDMATLITQAPKFGLSTTLAHHERFGQLEDNRGIIGATSTIANKVLFQVTGKDAHDFAPEFKNDPPTEMRDEDVYAVSQYPFYDLLQGHNNPLVRELVDRYIRPIKERLEDIYGDREAERLIHTEYLDTANLYRIDERIESTITNDRLLQRGVLGGARSEIAKALSQIDKLKQLNEEGILIRATIRILNRLFIDMMEGKLRSGQEEFSNKLIEISKAAILPQDDRRILELYIGLAYGDLTMQRIMPFECAKRQGLFKEHVEKVEREIATEYETQRAVFARRIWEMYQKNGDEILQENIKMYSKDGITYGRPELPADELEWTIKQEKDHLKQVCGWAISTYANGELPIDNKRVYGLHRLYNLIEDIAKTFKPLVRRVPNDITIPERRAIKLPSGIDLFPGNIYTLCTKNDLVERGYMDIVDSVDGLVKLCALLAKPENHLQVKTRQRGQKAVQTRTIADMVNEMEGELTELPKYTAYAKVLNGKEMWKGKITTHPLPITTYIYLPNTLRAIINAGCFNKAKIEEAIRTRQENWRPKAVDEPPVARDKNEKGPASPPDKPIIEPDGPPPPSRPKPGR